MDGNPNADSAMMLLQSINPNILSSEGDRAYYALLMTQARHKSYIDETDDSLINIAVRYYKSHASSIYYMKSCFYKATILYHRHDYRLATMTAMTARELAQKLKNTYWIAKTDELLSFIFSDTYNDLEAIKYSSEAAVLYKEVNKIANHRYSLCDLAEEYIGIDSLRLSQTLLDSLVLDVSQTKTPMDSTFVAYCLRAAVSAYFYDGQYLNAKQSIERLKVFRDYYTPKAADYIRMAEVYNALDECENLKTMMDSAQILAKDNVEKMMVNVMLTNYYKGKKQYEKALNCLEMALECQNQVADDMLKQSAVTAQRDFYNLQSEEGKKRSADLERKLVIYFFITLVIMTLVYYFYRLKMRIKKREIEKRINEILVLTEKLKNGDHENAVLVSQLTSQQDKSELLKILVESLFKERWKTINLLCDEYFEKGDSEKTRATIINDVEKEIKRICNPANLKQIESAVDEYMDGIVSKLREQCIFLKQEDILFITLLYAGFAPRAVCLFTEIKLKYFYNKRTRLMNRILDSNAPDKKLFVDKMKPIASK